MEPGYDVYEYSRRGFLKDLREVLSGGSKPDEYMAYDGSTALVMASRQGHGPVVRELLLYGANASLRTEDGSTLLHHAASGMSPDAAAALIEAGVSVNEPNEDGVTPLILAAHYGAADVVKVLCDKGADVNHEAEGWGNALDAAEGDIAAFLESLGAVRSSGGGDQPMASGAERFHYGCFESGMNPHVTPTLAPTSKPDLVKVKTKQATVGDRVRLARPKPGLLKEGEEGEVVGDDGSDCVPLKVQVGDAYDYYDYADVAVCEKVKELPPDSEYATPEGTQRYTTKRLGAGVPPSKLGNTGLYVSPLGFGCHRLADVDEHRNALAMAIKMGCNFVDLAPNYTDGDAEKATGEVLKELFESKKVRRDELVVATKVGNVLGKQMALSTGMSNMAKLNDAHWHCIAPEWIEQEITRSLQRLHLKCVDCVMLHCPECESKAEGVDMGEVYKRMGVAFRYLEKEVARGRIRMYGVSAAFCPLRPTDPEHLDLQEVVAQLPEGHHFKVLQFPLNFAEAPIKWQGHVARDANGRPLQDNACDADTLFEAAQKHGFATLTNRPLDGIYKESHGVLRFSSLDCEVRSFSELQLDNCDALEEKLNTICKFCDAPYKMPEGASGQLAAKTLKVLASLEGVDCVLLGMRKPEYVLSALPLSFGTPPLPAETALKAFRSVHSTVEMWFATAIHEADHGTSKDWRLPVNQRFVAEGAAGA